MSIETSAQHVAVRDTEALRRWFNEWIGSRLLWSRCTMLGAGRAEIEVHPPDEFRNPDGAIHGGLISAAVDQAGGLAIHSVIAERDSSATLHLDVQYLRAARAAPIRATGEVRRLGRNVAFATMRVVDDEGTECAVASGTWSVHADPSRR